MKGRLIVSADEYRALEAKAKANAVPTVEELDRLLRSSNKGYWTGTMLAQSIHDLMIERQEATKLL